MSALGGIPGFAYPELAYPDSEFLAANIATITVGAPGLFFTNLITAGRGNALYISSVFLAYVATAAVATRALFLSLLDADGNDVAQYGSPQQVTAGLTVTHQWSKQLSTAFVVSGNGLSPMWDTIMLPGYAAQIAVANAQAGDKITTIGVTGLTIPTQGTDRVNATAVPAPLLT